MAALQPRVRRNPGRDHEQLPGRGRRSRRHAPGRRHRLQHGRLQRSLLRADPAVTAARGETTLTFNVSANADDGDVTVSGSVGSGYPPSGAAAANSSGPVFTAGRRRAFGNFQILVPLLRFDTSSLPDNATVTSAKLRLHVTGKADDDNRCLVGEWYPSSNWPIDPTDWTQTTGTSALVGADLTGIAVGTSNELNLSGVAAISVSGYTGLRLGISGGQLQRRQLPPDRGARTRQQPRAGNSSSPTPPRADRQLR